MNVTILAIRHTVVKNIKLMQGHMKFGKKKT